MFISLLKGGLKYFQSLDRERALKKGEQIGSLLHLIKYRRKVVLKNLDIAFPSFSNNQKLNIYKNVLKYFGRNLVDFARLPIYVKNNEFQKIGEIVEGREVLEKYKNKGAIIITGHIGNWEIVGGFLESLSYNITVLAYRQKNKEINNLIESIRKSANIETIYHDQPLKRMLKELNKGRFLGFLADQNALRHRGVFVDFFGLPASTIFFPAKLSLKYNLPVIFSYNYLDLNSKVYKIFFKEINTKEFKEKNDYKGLTQKFTKELEDAIKKNPSQYLWTHKRWKTRPEGEPENIYD